jgi:2-polyprenyl-6-methoxyphenol hydroxylase-like FAD-dependent oxidoreductase
MPDLDTDVLIVGSGPAGSSAALALATYGVQTTVISKYGRLTDTPRAHSTNQRPMEALRDLGVEEEAMAEAVPRELMGNLLARPDNYVAFRESSATSHAEAEAALESALRTVLDRAQEVQA